MKKYLTMLLLAITGASPAQQNKHDYSIIHPQQWFIPNSNGLSYSIDTFRGSKALIIRKNFDNYKFGAVAYPRALNFTDGEIELDMVSGNGQDYLGLAFRIRDAHHYQTLYFRPASSGTINAIQYMPAKKDEFNWWDFESEKYQASAILPSRSWFHIKAVVKGQRLAVYVNRQTAPSMVYSALDPELKSGSVGFWIGNSSTCAFKNLMIKTY